jgi:uncharacterized protein YidB (DUF937 family)
MAKPSMTALLGLLAIKGYQNRDKIAEMLKGAGATGDKPGSGTQPGLGGVLGNLGGESATGGVRGLLGGGLGELLERFKQSGQEEVAQSWVNNGPNKEIAPPQLKQGRMSWQPWRSKPAFRRTSFSPGFRANCRRPSTNTRRTAGFPVRTLKPLNHGGTRDGHHLDDHHRVSRGRYRQVHHAGTQ